MASISSWENSKQAFVEAEMKKLEVSNGSTNFKACLTVHNG